jgi:hypothetical protein
MVFNNSSCFRRNNSAPSIATFVFRRVISIEYYLNNLKKEISMQISKVSVYNNQKNNLTQTQIQKQNNSNPSFGISWHCIEDGKKVPTRFGNFLGTIIECFSDILTPQVKEKLGVLKNRQDGFTVTLTRKAGGGIYDPRALVITKNIGTLLEDSVRAGDIVDLKYEEGWGHLSGDKEKEAYSKLLRQFLDIAKTSENLEKLFTDRDARKIAEANAKKAAASATNALKEELLG